MSIESIAITAALILIGLAAVSVIAFGIRNLFYGKHNIFSMVVALMPVVLLGVLGMVTGDWQYAMVLTAVIMLGLGALGLLFSSLRGLLGL